MGSILGILSGWKMIIAYLLLNIPWLVENPVIAEAIQKVAADPSRANITSLAINLLLLVGAIDRTRKNIVSDGSNK